jgi:hypothetical protein
MQFQPIARVSETQLADAAQAVRDAEDSDALAAEQAGEGGVEARWQARPNQSSSLTALAIVPRPVRRDYRQIHGVTPTIKNQESDDA